MQNIQKTFLLALTSLSFTFADNVATKKDLYVTPSAGPRVENGADVFITADLIFWEATQKGYDFAYSHPITGSSSKGTVYYANFQFDPGFQAALGLQLGHDGWDTLVNYTWFHPQHKTRNFSDTSDDLLYSQVGNEDSIYINGKLYYQYELDVIDFEIGRNFFISQYLSLRPFLGLKTAWNRQYSKQYFDAADFNYLIRLSQKSFEIGPRAGANAHYTINSNWSLYANTAFSALSNDCKNTAQATEVADDGAETLLSNTSDKQVITQPVLELGLGIQWDIWSDTEEYHLGLSAGYDFQFWNNNLYTRVPIINQDTQSISSLDLKSGDLSIQGLNIKIRLDF
jgi:hypothetical protein